MRLTQQQTDGIAEILRIGVDRAAASLVELVCDDVAVNVPSVAMLPICEISDWIRQTSPQFTPSAMLEFHGMIHGHLALIFSVGSASKLATALGVEPTAAGLQEVVEETGNILLNAVAGSMANCLGCNLSFDTPRYADAPDLIRHLGLAQKSGGRALFARTCFELAESTIEGQILLHLDQGSTAALIHMLELVAVH